MAMNTSLAIFRLTSAMFVRPPAVNSNNVPASFLVSAPTVQVVVVENAVAVRRKKGRTEERVPKREVMELSISNGPAPKQERKKRENNDEQEATTRFSLFSPLVFFFFFAQVH
jgi:hypothetical protein